MNRRDSLKAIGLTALSAGALLDGCKPKDAQEATPATAATPASELGRQDFEIERDARLAKETFFTPHELATVTALADIIIPKDDHSGSASDAGVPAYIEFVMKDEPDQQVPVRGGLRWLDVHCLDQFGKPFVDCTAAQQLMVVDAIAYPGKAKPEMSPGVAFFSRIRNLTASGFYTSQIGVKDLGYVGNQPGTWKGVPEDILKHYGMENV